MDAKLKHGLEVVSLITSGVVPWVTRLIQAELISPYYKPEVEIFATIGGVVTFGVTWYCFRGVPALDPKKKSAKRALVTFFICCVICAFISMTLGKVFDPGPGWTELVRLLWCAIFVGAASSLGWLLGALVRLIP